jgi:hypothetical protein
MKKCFVSAAVLVLIVGTWAPPLQAQKKEKKEKQYKEMATLIEGGSYEFRVQSVNPTGGNTISPSSIYTMIADQGKYKAYLPYFGRAYQASYGGDGGVEFDGDPENLEIRKNDKKRTITVSFDISAGNDKYNVTLSAGSGGYGNLSINSQKRQPISYYGPISPLN